MGKPFTNLRDLVKCLANAMNLINPEVENHHEKVAYFAWNLAGACGLSESEKRMTFYGALLHDIGSVMFEGSPSIFELELHPGRLASAGAKLLKMFPATAPLSEVIQSSQTPWQKIRRLPEAARAPRVIGQIIHLSDSVSLLLNEEKSVLNQVDYVRRCVHEVGEAEFSPDVLRAFDEVSRREGVWLDMLYRPELFLELIPDNRYLSLDDTIRLTELVSRIIDFRSPFTAMHSAGVAATAESLAALAGMSDSECQMMRIAGNLHDIGKLKIPKAILEKPGKLTDEEFNVMKEHAYFTYVLLSGIEGFEQVTEWAALHHEKLNGGGYPYHLAGGCIPLGSRIMAVADVFSAIMEDRPYRKGMDKARALEVLHGDVERGALSESIVELLERNFDPINEKRDREAHIAGRRYYAALEQTGEDRAQDS